MARAITQFLLAVIASAFAGDVVSAPLPLSHAFVPSAPTAGDLVRLRTTVSDCSPPATTDINVDVINRKIDVTYRIPGVVCEPLNPSHTLTPRFADIGRLPPGNYTTRVVECQESTGLQLCFVAFESSSTVAPALVRHAIPATS